MKKHISLFLLFVFLGAVLFSGCKKSGVTSSKADLSSEYSSSVTEDKDESQSNFSSTEDIIKVDGENTVNSKVEINKEPNTYSKTESSNSDYESSSSKPSSQVSSVSSEKEEGSASDINSDTNVKLTYEEYLELTPEKQQEYYESFDSVQAFAAWYNSAKAEYKENDDSIQIGGNGSIDLEDYIK